MNSIVLYFTEDSDSDYAEKIQTDELKKIEEWYQKWAHSNDVGKAVSLLRWLYARPDFDMVPPDLYQEHAKEIEDKYSISAKDVLLCLSEGKKLIWNL